MSITEALRRGPIDRPRTMFPRQDFPGTYRERMENSRKRLEESGVRGVLRELAELIKPQFSDVAVVEDDLTLGIEWNHRSVSESLPLFMLDRVTVEMDLSGNLSVCGKEKEVLTIYQWKSPEILEDAIAGAFNKPMTVVDQEAYESGIMGFGP